MDWARKHLSELVSVCRLCEEDAALTDAQRAAFAGIYSLAGQFTSLPNAGGQRNVATTIVIVCRACRSSFRYTCPGRTDWQQPCRLVQERTGLAEEQKKDAAAN